MLKLFHTLLLNFRFDNFAYFYHRYQLPKLNYTICTGGKDTLDGQGDLKNLHEHFLPKTFWHGQSKDDSSTLKSVLQKPLWQVRIAILRFILLVFSSKLMEKLPRNSRNLRFSESHFLTDFNNFPFKTMILGPKNQVVLFQTYFI